jgi:superfamily II DNA or RNA helicase
VQKLLMDLGIACTTRDERVSGRPVAVEFHGELRQEQLAAARAMLAHDMGVLSAGTAFGKTVVAAWLIAQRRVNYADLDVPVLARMFDRRCRG